MRTLAHAAVFALLSPQAIAQTPRACTFETCKAGMQVLASFEKSDPYYRCPNRELANYVATVVELFSMQALLLGKMPTITDVTEGPEFTAETKDMVDKLRDQAHVQTFDAAMALCHEGSNKRVVKILSVPDRRSLVAYVDDTASKFWMPLGHLERAK